MNFKVEASQEGARACKITTSRGEITTPVFMPVGTQASVKGLDFNDIYGMDSNIILANTYHLYLLPTPETIKNLGGLHGFSGYKGNFLTDSGGFQAFSLRSNTKNNDIGIEFKSHIDGSKHLFTPQKVLDIQYALNSDIMMILDDLPALPAPKERIKLSLERTIKWAKESLEYHTSQKQKLENAHQNIFAIIQGGVDFEAREICAKALVEMDGYDGYAIGGLSVGEERDKMYDTIEFTTPFMPVNKPRYLMGVGTPQDLLEAIDRGVDMFDCVMPTRNARNSTLFTSNGKISIKSSRFAQDSSPIDEKCDCYTCKNFSRGYIHHLFRSGELSYFRLASIHNLHFYLNLVRGARGAILSGNWSAYKKERLQEIGNG